MTDDDAGERYVQGLIARAVLAPAEDYLSVATEDGELSDGASVFSTNTIDTSLENVLSDDDAPQVDTEGPSLADISPAGEGENRKKKRKKSTLPRPYITRHLVGRSRPAFSPAQPRAADPAQGGGGNHPQLPLYRTTPSPRARLLSSPSVLI